MRVPAGLLAAACFAVLLAPRTAAAQRLAASHDWDRLQYRTVAAPAGDAALPTGADASRPRARAQSPQRLRYGNPTPYVIGGSAVGAFAGGVIGYATCVAGDGDCSALVRLAAGTGIGAFLGAVFWLASAVER